MHSSISEARQFDDLLFFMDPQSPYYFDRIFEAKGFFARSFSKKKFKFLKKIDGMIQEILQPEEKVINVTWGVDLSTVEQLFMGWIMHYINRKALVFTNKRIIILQISTRNKPIVLRAQLHYSAIKNIGTTLFGNLKLNFVNGTQRLFVYIPGRDKKFIKNLKQDPEVQSIPPNSDAVSIENLCPYCYVKVNGFPKFCASCHRTFKSPKKAALLSLLFPGFGDLYLGQHRLFAAGEILGASILWTVVLIGLFVPEEGKTGPTRETLVGVAFLGILIFIFVHGMDALVTLHMARKGIFPNEKMERDRVVY